MKVALPVRVPGVRCYQDLDCLEARNELKLRVHEIIERSVAKHDFDFRDQLRDAASSGPSNISEAFAHYRHPDAARFARIAKSSLTETHNHLGDGVDRKYWTAEDAAPLLALAKRAIGATTGWIRHLETSKAPEPYWKKQGQRIPENPEPGSKRRRTWHLAPAHLAPAHLAPWHRST
jgi:four helix bundle protein